MWRPHNGGEYICWLLTPDLVLSEWSESCIIVIAWLVLYLWLGPDPCLVTSGGCWSPWPRVPRSPWPRGPGSGLWSPAPHVQGGDTSPSSDLSVSQWPWLWCWRWWWPETWQMLRGLLFWVMKIVIKAVLGTVQENVMRTVIKAVIRTVI